MFCAIFAFGEQRRRLCLLYPRSSLKYKFIKSVLGAYSHGVAHRACSSLSVTYTIFANMIVRINKHPEQAKTQERRKVRATLSEIVVDGKL
jgi:hypothetical protein